MNITTIRDEVNIRLLADLGECRGDLAEIRIVRGLLDAREMRVLARMDEFAAQPEGARSFPDADLAAAAKKGSGAADKVRQRSKAGSDVPQLGDALAAGETTGDRLDVVARVTAGMNDAERARFARHGDRLRDAARDLSDRDYRALVERLAQAARDDDGLGRLEQQKRATRLRSWTDGDGMWRLDGRFDPESGVLIDSRLRKLVDSLFHSGLPDGAPVDLIDRQQFLAAHALIHLATGAGAGSGTDSGTAGAGSTGSMGPDITVIIDADTLLNGRHDHSRVDVGLGTLGLPVETVRRWACLGTITPVIASADGTRLLLGREQRLANRHQRRALRVLYATCALCDTAFERCEIHHLHPWEAGGSTDIDNLLPLCTRHHHAAHEGGWELRLDTDRTLRITRPGGSESVHGPPTTRAA